MTGRRSPRNATVPETATVPEPLPVPETGDLALVAHPWHSRTQDISFW